MTNPDFQKALDNALNECPFRQHSEECKKFHKAMLTAQQAINDLLRDAIDRLDEGHVNGECFKSAELLEQLGLTGGSDEGN